MERGAFRLLDGATESFIIVMITIHVVMFNRFREQVVTL